MVEIDPVAGNVLRIFSTPKKAWALEPERVRELPRSEAVSRVRKQIWERCAGRCEYCGKTITENGPFWQRMQMHEEVPRGNGGEISLENSRGICDHCHKNDERGHASRKLHFGESNVENN